MKYLITESQLKLISELERTWRDVKYVEIYEKLKHKLIPHFENLINEYSERDSHITLYDSDGVKLMVFNKHSGELYYDRSLDRYDEMLPHPFWSVNARYLLADVFVSLFPKYKVTEVRSAHIS